MSDAGGGIVAVTVADVVESQSVTHVVETVLWGLGAFPGSFGPVLRHRDQSAPGPMPGAAAVSALKVASEGVRGVAR